MPDENKKIEVLQRFQAQKKAGFKDIHSFKNSRTGNKVWLSVKEL